MLYSIFFFSFGTFSLLTIFFRHCLFTCCAHCRIAIVRKNIQCVKSVIISSTYKFFDSNFQIVRAFHNTHDEGKTRKISKILPQFKNINYTNTVWFNNWNMLNLVCIPRKSCWVWNVWLNQMFNDWFENQLSIINNFFSPFHCISFKIPITILIPFFLYINIFI